MIPFDHAPYTQSMFLHDPEYQGQILTVQYCKKPVSGTRITEGLHNMSLSKKDNLHKELRFVCGCPSGCDASELDVEKHCSIDPNDKEKRKYYFDKEKYMRSKHGKCVVCGENEEKGFICTKKHMTCWECMIELVH